MKKIVIFCLFLLAKLFFAQQEINTAFADQMNATFAPLDKTKIQHGVLLDQAMEFTNVPAFNGTLTDSTYSTLISLDHN